MNRVHLSIRAAPELTGGTRIAALEESCARLVSLGAIQVARHEPTPPLDGGHMVLTDPEGNEFRLD